MRICIIGAGAIGGLLAAKLAAAGERVTVVARGDHLRAISANGLRLITRRRVGLVQLKRRAGKLHKFSGTRRTRFVQQGVGDGREDGKTRSGSGHKGACGYKNGSRKFGGYRTSRAPVHGQSRTVDQLASGRRALPDR